MSTNLLIWNVAMLVCMSLLAWQWDSGWPLFAALLMVAVNSK